MKKRKARHLLDPAVTDARLAELAEEPVAMPELGPDDLIALCGDLHGNVKSFFTVAREARRAGAKLIVSLGDFGYWPHDREGIHYLREVERALVRYGLHAIFIDGNHENLARLNQHEREADGLAVITSRLRWAPRGTRLELGGVRFLAMGGAYSVDRWDRKAGISWWPEEMITDAQVARAVRGWRVDVVLSHDCPADVRIPGPDGYKTDPATGTNRAKLLRVVETVRSHFVFHGHWHVRYRSELRLYSGDLCVVEGLGRDKSGRDLWTIRRLGDLG